MAHVIYRPSPDGPPAMQLIINGLDFSNEVYADGVELVSVGDDEFAEVGVKVTFALSRFDLGGDEDVQVTDRLPEVAQLVRSLASIQDR